MGMAKKRLRCYLIEGKEFCDSPMLDIPGVLAPNCTNCLLSHILKEIRALNSTRRDASDPPESS